MLRDETGETKECVIELEKIKKIVGEVYLSVMVGGIMALYYMLR